MYLKLRSDIVRRNIEVFKIILKRASHVGSYPSLDEREQMFKIFVHKVRGEVRFPDLSSEPLDSKDWIAATFHLRIPETTKEDIVFNVSGMDGSFFSWNGLDAEAFSSLKETIKTIQLMTKFLPRLKSFTSTLREFSQMNIDSFLDELPAKDLIHEAWHQLSREDCESKCPS